MNQDLVVIPETRLPSGLVIPSFRAGRYMSTVNAEGTVNIRADATPTVRIDYRGARKAAEASGLRLLAETHALAIAVNVASVGANWTGGEVGVGLLKQGLRKWSVGSVQRNDYAPQDQDESRAFLLSNGEPIYDVAGHIYSWVFDDVQGDEDGVVARRFAKDSLSITCAPAPSLEKGVGWYPDGGDNWSGSALVRGGRWRSDGSAGVFYLNGWSPGNRGGYVGFRCTLP